jgi:hypothetical protein
MRRVIDHRMRMSCAGGQREGVWRQVAGGGRARVVAGGGASQPVDAIPSDTSGVKSTCTAAGGAACGSGRAHTCTHALTHTTAVPPLIRTYVHPCSTLTGSTHAPFVSALPRSSRAAAIAVWPGGRTMHVGA